MYNNNFTCLHYKTQQVLKSRWSYLVYQSKTYELVELMCGQMVESMCSYSYLMNNLSLATKNEAGHQALSRTLAAHLLCSHSYLMNNLSLATKNEAGHQALSKTLAAHLLVIVRKILLSLLRPFFLQVQVG